MRTPLALAIALLLGALLLPPQVAAQDSSLAKELDRLRRDMNTLQSYVFRGDKKAAGSTVSGPIPEFATQDSVSALQVQVQELRRRMREISGTFEEIDHRIARLTERFDKLVADVDLRLRTLEEGRGTTPAGSSAAPAPSGREVAASEGTTVIRSDGSTSGPGTAAEDKLLPGQKPFGVLSRNDVTQFKNTGQVQPSAERPSLPAGSGGESNQVRAQAPAAPQALPAPPPVTTAKPAGSNGAAQLAALPAGTPKEQYDHAYNLLLRRDLPKAEAALKAFLAQHPEHELADNAIFWLGETFYARKNYQEAIRVYYDAYRTYPKGNKAPDVLLKLGMSLGTIGEKESACSAFEKLTSSYSKASPRILETARRERQSLDCK